MGGRLRVADFSLYSQSASPRTLPRRRATPKPANTAATVPAMARTIHHGNGVGDECTGCGESTDCGGDVVVIAVVPES
jgi:hypothetical protein